jgi:hypothetical protein
MNPNPVAVVVDWVEDCETNDEISWSSMESVQMGLEDEDDSVQEVGRLEVTIVEGCGMVAYD